MESLETLLTLAVSAALCAILLIGLGYIRITHHSEQAWLENRCLLVNSLATEKGIAARMDLGAEAIGKTLVKENNHCGIITEFDGTRIKTMEGTP